MAYKQVSTGTAVETVAWNYYPQQNINLNMGLNVVDKEIKLSSSQTSNMLNMWWKNGELSKRWGQNYLLDSESPELISYSSYDKLFNGYIIKHTGTKLYKQHPTTGVISAIGTVNANKGVFFKFNDILYYKQQGKYVKISNTFVVTDIVPYVPTIIINRLPTGGGSTNEQYNRLGAGFKNSFNGNGSATAYTLTDTALDATTVTALVNGTTITEGSGLTVNRTTGVVTFTTAPTTGTNNVIITAYKTVQADIDVILNSKYVTSFGGQNENRIFIAGGNGGYYYWTGVGLTGIDPTYFAYNNYNIVGSSDDVITGFGKQYETLCIFKESEIYGVTYTFNGTTGVFNTFSINNQIGCNCPDTIQSISNNLIWTNTIFGVCAMVVSSSTENRNVYPISRNINPKLLAEENMKAATAVDYDNKYWLCINDKVYLWDYAISPYVDSNNPDISAQNLSWWYFDNINAAAWIRIEEEVYYIRRDNGKTVKFQHDKNLFTDFGGAINAIYRYPIRDLGDGVYEFTVNKGYVDVNGSTRTSYIAKYFTSDDPYGDPVTEEIVVGTFRWDDFSWANFTWSVMPDKYTSVLLPLAKNIQYFGCEFSNNVAGRDMNIGNVRWEYRATKKIK